MARPRRPAARRAARKPVPGGRPARARPARAARPPAPPAAEPRAALLADPPLSARTEGALRDALCAAGRRLFAADLIGAGEGNLSARLDEGTFLVTPSGVSKADLDPDDLLVVDAAGAVLSGRLRPSTELRMHLAAYAARPEIAAAVHAHPVTAVALTVAGVPWPGDVVPEAAVTLGPVAITRFAVPGTADVPAALAEALPGHDVLLLSRHGALTLGATVTEAVDRMETLERVARIALAARAFGGCTPIAPEVVDRVLAAAGRPPRGGPVSRFKLGVRQGDGFAAHAHSHAFRLEHDESGPPRIVAAPDRDQVGLLIELARTLPEPFVVVYVLLSMRTLRPPGRYQSTRPVSREQLEGFLGRFRAFLEEDGRHHLWIGAAAEPSTLVYDQHQVLTLYGRLDEYQPVLTRAGMGEGPVIVPAEHQHASHDELDGEEHALFAWWNWTWNPLEPEDDPLD